MTRADNRVYVALDVFPSMATITAASTTLDNVRSTIADGNLTLYRLTGSGIQVVYSKPVIGDTEGSVSQGVAVPTEDGIVWIEQKEGCSCGSQLGQADVYGGRLRIMTGLRPQ